MALKIAFVGFDRTQTKHFFLEMIQENKAQALHVDKARGKLILRDGTEIRRIDSVKFLEGCRFDQIIIADDSRRNCISRRLDDIARLEYCCRSSIVPRDFRFLIYDTDYDSARTQ